MSTTRDKQIEEVRAAVASAAGDDKAKLKFAFDLRDGDRNGAIDEREMLQIIASGLVGDRLDFAEQQVRRLTSALFR